MIPDAKPVFSVNMSGTAPSFSKPFATHWGMIFQCNAIVITHAVCHKCVLWMYFECVKDVLWMWWMWCGWMGCGCVMDVLWMCYGCVTDVLWMCYWCVRDVLWMHWGGYGCVNDAWCMRDGWMVDALYLLCKLCCKWYCNCDIVVVLWYHCYVKLCILFFRA